MEESRKWAWIVSGSLFAVLGAVPGEAGDVAAESPLPRVGAVTARTVSLDGSSQEETGNCLLWTTGDRTYTLGDLHTVMAGAEGASSHVADEIQVKVGQRSSRARLVWPPEGRRNVLVVDIAILELEGGIVGQPFRPEDFAGAADSLPRGLYLIAPGHRSQILAIDAPSVGNRSQWFLYRELAHGDSGGMVFVVQDGRVVPQGVVSAIGSLPGESVRGTVLYGRDALRIFVAQFLQSRATAARNQHSTSSTARFTDRLLDEGEGLAITSAWPTASRTAGARARRRSPDRAPPSPACPSLVPPRVRAGRVPLPSGRPSRECRRS
jgi:hypothetical protein